LVTPGPTPIVCSIVRAELPRILSKRASPVKWLADGLSKAQDQL
jgi:hypothetical protein